MENIWTEFGKLDLNSRSDINVRNEIPFQPTGHLAAKLNDTPRYLFRVYSKKIRGENTNEWVKSGAAINGTLDDIFGRDASQVGKLLDDHLQTRCPVGDPFMSWTTSLPFIVQYAIYKHRRYREDLQTIQLCVVDTTKFPSGVFLKDLDLIDEFEAKYPSLRDFHGLRRKQHRLYSGFFYFGEYLSQGQLNIKGRSCIVSCDKIVNDDLFKIAPCLKDELQISPARWANATVALREPFYPLYSQSVEETQPAKLIAAMMISLEFSPDWFLPIFANLVSFSPRPAQDPGICGVIICVFPSPAKRCSLSEGTTVISDEKIPEVQQFGRIMRDIKEDGILDRFASWLHGMDKDQLVPFLRALGRVTTHVSP